jgi:hypothetical protein
MIRDLMAPPVITPAVAAALRAIDRRLAALDEDEQLETPQREPVAYKDEDFA